MLITSLADYKSFMEVQATALQVTQRSALATYDTLAREQSAWVASGDARLAHFAQIANHCNSEIVTVLALADCISSAAWHKSRMLSGSVEDMNILITETDKIARKNAFLQAWTLTENSIRRIRSAITGAAAIGPIVNHCAALYNTDLAHARAAEFMELINLVTKVRNTSHNDFSYYPDRGSDVILGYKSHTYSFVIGKPVDFFTWAFVHDRMRDLLELFEQTVRHPVLARLAQVGGTARTP